MYAYSDESDSERPERLLDCAFPPVEDLANTSSCWHAVSTNTEGKGAARYEALRTEVRAHLLSFKRELPLVLMFVGQKQRLDVWVGCLEEQVKAVGLHWHEVGADGADSAGWLDKQEHQLDEWDKSCPLAFICPPPLDALGRDATNEWGYGPADNSPNRRPPRGIVHRLTVQGLDSRAEPGDAVEEDNLHTRCQQYVQYELTEKGVAEDELLALSGRMAPTRGCILV